MMLSTGSMSLFSISISLVLFFSLVPPSLAAQLFHNASSLPPSAPAACASALLANISCSALIAPAYVSSGGALSVATLQTLCTDGCASSLKAYQSSVEQACGNASYTWSGAYNRSVPAIVEPVVWAHGVACLQSGTTYCVPNVTQTKTNATAGGGGVAPCSDCFLRYEAAMLGSSYGQQRLSPAGFSSLLASCNVPATSYPYTTPAASTTSTTTAATASTTPFCAGTQYTVQGGDTCASIAQKNSVATDRFITANHLDYNCSIIPAGKQVCVPQSCALYQVRANDTCNAILANQTYSLNQLVSWNPTIHNTCDNLDGMVGREICISPPGTTSWNISSATPAGTWNVTFVLPPTSFTVAMNQTIVPNYTTTYLNPVTAFNITTSTQTVNTASASAYASLTRYCPITSNDTIAGWTIWDLPSNCTSALEVYCAPELGNATVAPPSTVFPSTCSPAYWDGLLSATATTSTGGPPGPTQTGVAAGCDAWYLVQANDTCAGIVAEYGNFTLAQFYAWNPAVGSQCAYLIPKDAVCVGVAGASASASHSASSSVGVSSSATRTGSGATTTTVPSPTMPSTDPQCTSYYYVQSGDSCYNIEQAYKISADEFNAWNPYIGSNCANLWVSEYICVGAPYTSTAGTTSTAHSTPTTTSSATATVPSPLEPSTDAQCTKWHYVVSGDTCYSIEQSFGITADQFNRWNPAVGTNCGGLWLDYYVCVAAPN